MSKVIATTIGGGNISYDRRINRRYFRSAVSNVGKKRSKFSRQDIKNLKASSLMAQAGAAWNLLTQEQKDAWIEAGDEIGLTAYQAYLQDKIYRIKNSIAGDATPSAFHQYKVGYINIAESSGNFLLRQVGPEIFEFPASLHLHYKTDLTDEDPDNGFLKVRFKYKYDEGGGEQEQSDELDLDLSSEWVSDNVGITEHTGLTGHWELEIEGDDINGDFWFDDIYMSAIDTQLSKDPFCNHPTLRFNQLVIPAGVSVSSVYPT